MKVCVFGAGAVGGHVAARLLAGGVKDVSVIARGAQLTAIRKNGLTLKLAGRELSGRPVAATDDPSTLPPQDLVVVALKAPALPDAAPAIAQLLAPEGCALFATNGIPWWWRHGLPGSASSLPLLDPQGTLWQRLRERTLGCVVYSGNEVVAPGVIECKVFDRWIVGEPDNALSPRLLAVAGLFEHGGFDIKTSTDLRRDIWTKLLLNASRNTLAALTRLPSLYLSLDDGLRQMLVDVMSETLAVARATGWDVSASVDLTELASAAGRSPTQRPSMLQDTLAGRPLEHDALLGQLTVFAREHGVATPVCDVLLALLRGLDRSFRL